MVKVQASFWSLKLRPNKHQIFQNMVLNLLMHFVDKRFLLLNLFSYQMSFSNSFHVKDSWFHNFWYYTGRGYFQYAPNIIAKNLLAEKLLCVWKLNLRTFHSKMSSQFLLYNKLMKELQKILLKFHKCWGNDNISM